MRKPGHSVYVTDATDLPSFLEPDGPLPASVIRFTEYLGSIIAGASHSPSPEWQALKLKCRRRPGRRPCPGSIRVRIGEESPPEILWDCPRCGERGIIRNWQGSEWDDSGDRWNLFEAERSYTESMFHAGRSCCAGHLNRHEEALGASRRAIELEPGNQAYVNDLGWSQVLAERLDEAVETLERAVSLDTSDELARENLARCKAKILEREKAR